MVVVAVVVVAAVWRVSVASSVEVAKSAGKWPRRYANNVSSEKIFDRKMLVQERNVPAMLVHARMIGNWMILSIVVAFVLRCGPV